MHGMRVRPKIMRHYNKRLPARHQMWADGHFSFSLSPLFFCYQRLSIFCLFSHENPVFQSNQFIMIFITVHYYDALPQMCLSVRMSACLIQHRIRAQRIHTPYIVIYVLYKQKPTEFHIHCIIMIFILDLIHGPNPTHNPHRVCATQTRTTLTHRHTNTQHSTAAIPIHIHIHRQISNLILHIMTQKGLYHLIINQVQKQYLTKLPRQ